MREHLPRRFKDSHWERAFSYSSSSSSTSKNEAPSTIPSIEGDEALSSEKTSHIIGDIKTSGTDTVSELAVLMDAVEGRGAGVIVIKDKSGVVFGALISEEMKKSDDRYGVRDTILFQCNPFTSQDDSEVRIYDSPSKLNMVSVLDRC